MPLLDYVKRTNKYRQPVYDPQYVYAPWKQWVVLGVVICVGGMITWLSIFALSVETAVQETQQPLVLTDTQEPVPAVGVDTPDPVSVDQTQKVFFRVVKVVDGDTVDILMNGNTERLRLIGINTPETVDPRKPVQCFGREASDKAKSMLSGSTISIEQDPSQGERDTYGRLLAYIFLEDGTNFNKYMIAEGYAHEYTYRIPYKYQVEFKAAQADARSGERGLWAATACAGSTT